MSITEKLTASKNALASLLTFANAKTGKSDPDIGEAIRTLVDGYGGGGGFTESEFTLNEDRTTNGFVVPVSGTPELILIIYNGNASVPSTGGRSTKMILLLNGKCIFSVSANVANTSWTTFSENVVQLKIEGNTIICTLNTGQAGAYALLSGDYRLIYV